MKNQDLQIIRSLPKMNKFIKQMPVLSHVSTTLKTWKSCVVCRGGRTVCVRSRHNNIITHKYCPECKGTGMVYGRDD